MLNGDDKENGFKTSRSNQPKNKLHVQQTFFLLISPPKKFARAARFFVFHLPLFCTTTTSIIGNFRYIKIQHDSES